MGRSKDKQDQSDDTVRRAVASYPNTRTKVWKMGLSEHGEVRQMDKTRDLRLPPQCSRSLKLTPIGYFETSLNNCQ
jgi:hypothetical protein